MDFLPRTRHAYFALLRRTACGGTFLRRLPSGTDRQRTRCDRGVKVRSSGVAGGGARRSSAHFAALEWTQCGQQLGG